MLGIVPILPKERRDSRDSVGKELLPGRQLLGNHADDPDHAQPPGAQLEVLHLPELYRIRRLQPERVKAYVFSNRFLTFG